MKSKERAALAEIVSYVAQVADLYEGETAEKVLRKIQKIACDALGGNQSVADLERLRADGNT